MRVRTGLLQALRGATLAECFFMANPSPGGSSPAAPCLHPGVAGAPPPPPLPRRRSPRYGSRPAALCRSTGRRRRRRGLGLARPLGAAANPTSPARLPPPRPQGSRGRPPGRRRRRRAGWRPDAAAMGATDPPPPPPGRSGLGARSGAVGAFPGQRSGKARREAGP